MYSDSLGEAIAYAASAHREQTRKATSIPYISHLLAVTAIVLEAGGNETEAIAAVLHDVVEDQPFEEGGGRARLADVESHFGSHVAKMVEALSDWVSERGDEQKSAAGYKGRKAKYHEHLRSEQDKSVLLVSAADKLHNARSMDADLDKLGPDLWKRFNGTREDIIWNYDELIAIYRSAVADERRKQIVESLAKTVESLKAKSGHEPVAAS
jgi:(p)ppGpp synthase/HD superfamily hydrolase